MRKWCGIAGLLVWLASAVGLAGAMRHGVIAEPVDLRLADGTPIRGTLYRPRNDVPDLAGAVVTHGTALSHRSCAPALALPLARQDVMVLAIDLRGHGHSGGSLPRRELDAGATPSIGPDDYPEIDAALDFLRRHPLFIGRHPEYPPCWLALVGHSRGGLAAAAAGCHRGDVRAVVSVGAAPENCGPSRPNNLLILTGSADLLCPRAECVRAIRRATGGAVCEPYQTVGDFDAGSARRLQFVGGTNHLTELADRGTAHHVVAWVTRAVHFHIDPPSPAWLPGLVAGLLAATLAGVPACAWPLAGAARAWLGPPAAPDRPARLVRLALALGLLLGAAPAVAAAARWLDVGPVYLALPGVALLTSAAGCCLAVAGPGPLCDARSAARGLAVGLLGLAAALVWLGVPWGETWLDLLPPARRAVVAAALLPLLLPGSLCLAAGVRRLAGATRWAPALAWLGVAAALWCGQALFASAQRPLFAIPVVCLSASFVVALPLWLVPHRPGLSLARAVCHAGGLAWLMACHLPFVHDG